jgi:hypothetical protein
MSIAGIGLELAHERLNPLATARSGRGAPGRVASGFTRAQRPSAEAVCSTAWLTGYLRGGRPFAAGLSRSHDPLRWAW